MEKYSTFGKDETTEWSALKDDKPRGHSVQHSFQGFDDTSIRKKKKVLRHERRIDEIKMEAQNNDTEESAEKDKRFMFMYVEYLKLLQAGTMTSLDPAEAGEQVMVQIKEKESGLLKSQDQIYLEQLKQIVELLNEDTSKKVLDDYRGNPQVHSDPHEQFEYLIIDL